VIAHGCETQHASEFGCRSWRFSLLFGSAPEPDNLQRALEVEVARGGGRTKLEQWRANFGLAAE